MAECLVIQLREAITDAYLPRLNEVFFKLKRTTNPTGITALHFELVSASTFEIKGTGYFTNAAGTENLGKSIDKPLGEVELFVTADTTIVSCLNKHAIGVIGGSNVTTKNLTTSATGSVSLAPLCCYNDISDFGYMSNLAKINADYQQLSGDISILATLPKLGTLNIPKSVNVFGDISVFTGRAVYIAITLTNTAVSGDIASFSNLINLNTLYLDGTDVSGDISTIGTLVKMRWMKLSGTQIKGDISAFTGYTLMTECPELKKLTDIAGDLSVLPNNMKFTSNQGGQSDFKWTAKGTRTDILALENVRVVEGADQFLIDMATCNLNPPSSTAYYSQIKLFGNVTAASTSAITTLQGKGVTVIITPI